jgi:nicotinamidase-related amidase
MPAKVAVLGIDLHRGHLDPEVATLPLPPDRARQVVARCEALFGGCRAAGIPVVHVVTTYRAVEEILNNPAWRRRSEDPTSTRRNMAGHNLAGMPGCTVMPSLMDPRDLLVTTKKRYDCFLATDLDFLLRSRGIDTLWVTGVNTNSCVLATAIEASCRDYDVTVVSDCVDTMDEGEFHSWALAILQRAFAEVRTADELLRELALQR